MADKKLNQFVATGRIHNGKLVLNNEKYFRGMIAFFYDCPVRVIIERVKKSRSQEQNNWYWGMVLQTIATHTGHSAEELHEIFKAKYLHKKRIWRGGEVMTTRTTTELSTSEFAEYLSSIILEANEMEIVIPEADKDWYVKAEFGDK